MPVSLTFAPESLIGFLLVFTRVAGAMAFVPIPGFSLAPAKARVILALGITLALSGVWPAVSLPEWRIGLLVVWMLSEAAIGVTVGLAVAFLNEAFVLSSQVFGLQAGYGYASTIDPATEADSSILQIFAHLATGLLFFSLGMDRQVLRVFADSLREHPPGSLALSIGAAQPILGLGAGMFSIAVRLALPVVALLLLVDLSLALLGRINAQLQLLLLAFPVKMLLSMALLGAIAVVMPVLYRTAAEPTFRVLEELLGAAR